MSQLDDMLTGHPDPTFIIVTWPVILLLAILVLWAIFAEIDEVSVAEGSETGKMPITPGMDATVDIHTNKKTVMDYLDQTGPEIAARSVQGALTSVGRHLDMPRHRGGSIPSFAASQGQHGIER